MHLSNKTIRPFVRWYCRNQRGRLPLALQSLSIGQWDVSGVTDMTGVFENEVGFNEDISSWNVSNVTTMCRMFCNAVSFNGNVGCWDVSRVVCMTNMFSNARSFRGTVEMDTWDVSQVRSMYGMFSFADQFDVSLNHWNMSQVLNTQYMFYAAHALSRKVLPVWKPSARLVCDAMYAHSGIPHARLPPDEYRQHQLKQAVVHILRTATPLCDELIDHVVLYL